MHFHTIPRRTSCLSLGTALYEFTLTAAAHARRESTNLNAPPQPEPAPPPKVFRYPDHAAKMRERNQKSKNASRMQKRREAKRVA